MDLTAATARTRKTMASIFGHGFLYEHCLSFDVSRAFDEASGMKKALVSGLPSATRRCETRFSLEARIQGFASGLKRVFNVSLQA